MKQIMKRAWLVLCMAVCVLSLSACGSKSNVAQEPIPQIIEDTMKTGAEDYIRRFDSYDDATLESELKRVEKQKNSVMVSALTSWKNIKGELGRMVPGDGTKSAILSQTLERVKEDEYKVVLRVSFEKKELDFSLTAEEVVGSNGNNVLTPTELVFSPVYTTGEKLTKAGMNTLMGMGTVFLVLIFISFIISMLKGVNVWEAKAKARNSANGNAAAPAAPAAPTPAVIPAPAAAPAAALVPVMQSQNLADDRELVAVITAAIAATQNVPVEGLVVRSIRRKSSSNWKKA